MYITILTPDVYDIYHNATQQKDILYDSLERSSILTDNKP